MTPTQQKIYLDTASSLAYGICRDAIWNNQSCNWIGCSNEEYLGMPKGYAKSLQSNFYDGTAGIAFFLCQLLKVNSDSLVKETAEGSLQQMMNQMKENGANDHFGKLGFHTGYPGQAYVLMHAAEILHSNRYRDAAVNLIEQTLSLPESAWGLDVIDGAAGAIPCLINLYKNYPDKKLRDFIVALGEYLVKTSISDGNTTAWDTMAGTTRPLTGYGHGAAGIASALLELSAFTDDKKYQAIAEKAFSYENRHFSSTHQNWPDFRNNPQSYQQDTTAQEEHCGIAWCHGAPGIALSRIRAYELTGSPLWKKDAELAVDTTVKHFGYDSLANYSLCHGLFGNAETLLYAATVLDKKELTEMVEKAVAQSLEQTFSKNNPIANGLHNYNETPDFMLGSSGMGYFFLRMYDQKMFPSVLMLKA